MQNIVVSIIATFFSISGNILVNNRYRLGFLAWIVSNIIWIAIELTCYRNWVRLCQLTVYTVLAVHGYIKWANQAKAEKE